MCSCMGPAGLGGRQGERKNADRVIGCTLFNSVDKALTASIDDPCCICLLEDRCNICRPTPSRQMQVFKNSDSRLCSWMCATSHEGDSLFFISFRQPVPFCATLPLFHFGILQEDRVTQVDRNPRHINGECLLALVCLLIMP